jgi:hypothetical protein
MAQKNSLKPIVQGSDNMAIQMDSLDYYYNTTNGFSCWGGGEVTPEGFYEPSNMYMLNNATQIYQDLTVRGWAFNPIMAVLGNMAYESSLNPAQSEILKPLNGNFGYGLCQWTPRSTTIEPYMASHSYPLTSGYYQLEYLDSGVQWIPKSAYNNMTWNEFKHSTLDVQTLTTIFLKCYERGLTKSYRYYCSDFYERYFSSVVTSKTIYVTYEGNGNAYATPSHVEVGDTFTLYANANDDDEIDTITGTTENGQSIAMSQLPVATYTYDASYGNYISIHVKFTGETPYIPPTPPILSPSTFPHHMPIWMYPIFNKKGNK